MEICAVCLDEIQINKYIFKCTHSYHANCIKQWYGNCPVCRADRLVIVHTLYVISAFFKLPREILIGDKLVIRSFDKINPIVIGILYSFVCTDNIILFYLNSSFPNCNNYKIKIDSDILMITFAI
jgi:hypothetical protein